MNRLRLKSQLVRHEGLRLKPYHDTVGKLTIGVGRNLDDVGITEEEASTLLDNDILRVEQTLARCVQSYSALNDVRQRVLVDMAFNLGVRGLLAFRKMLAAVERGDYSNAAAEMRDSDWFHQVGDQPDQRGHTLATMMEKGTD